MRRRRPVPERSGVVLLLVTLWGVVLLGWLGVGVEVGLLAWHRRLLQTGLDAAALAGARFLPDDPPQAITQAQAMARAQGIAPAEVAAELPPTVGQVFAPNDTLDIGARRTLPPGFLGLLGLTEVTARTRARAVSVAAWPTDLWPLGLTADTTCTGECPLKLGAPAGQNGNFGALAYPGDRGADAYRQRFLTGYRGEIPPPTLDPQGRPVWTWPLDTEPGDMVGPTRQALDVLVSWAAQRLCDGGVDACRALYDRDGCATDLRCPLVGVVPRLRETWAGLQGRTRVTVVGFVCLRITRVEDSGGHMTVYATQPPHCRADGLPGVRPQPGWPLEATGLVVATLWQ